MTLPLSKTLDPADFELLAEELTIVDAHFTQAREQHPLRRWEYAMALRALATWLEGKDYQAPTTAVDVGGTGSPFALILQERGLGCPVVIDPDWGEDLAHYLTTPSWDDDESHPMLHQAVFCLSVLEHVDDLDQFLYHLSCLVAPSGLLFLTFDYVDTPGIHTWPEDHYHFHWMRKRIVNAYALEQLVTFPLLQRDFGHLGSIDLTWHGAHVYDYAFASLAMVKRR